MNTSRTLYALIFAIVLVFSAGILNSFGQLKENHRKSLSVLEDSLARLGEQILYGINDQKRFTALSKFIPLLKSALKTPYSFYYPFEKLKTISILYPKDKSFRLFSWNLPLMNGSYRYYAALQKNTHDGSLELTPFYDYSDSIQHPMDTICSPQTWYGCLYYNLVEKRYFGKKYYTLFGWDGNDLWSTKKVMEILHFEKGEVILGAPIIQLQDTLGKKYEVNRFIIEYKKDAFVTLNYNPELDMVIFDHLVPPNPSLEGLQFTYIPDGTYEGFVFKRGKWRWQEKVFDYAINEPDNPPFPNPVLDKRD